MATYSERLHCARGQHNYTVNYVNAPSGCSETAGVLVRDCPLHSCTCDQGACSWHQQHQKISLYLTTQDGTA
jgi:hypothetical protein